MYIGEHHLTLCGDWPCIGNYGRCAHCAPSKCLHYVLHPPSSNKSTINGIIIFTLTIFAMCYVYIQYSVKKLITLLYLIIYPYVCVF